MVPENHLVIVTPELDVLLYQCPNLSRVLTQMFSAVDHGPLSKFRSSSDDSVKSLWLPNLYRMKRLFLQHQQRVKNDTPSELKSDASVINHDEEVHSRPKFDFGFKKLQSIAQSLDVLSQEQGEGILRKGFQDDELDNEDWDAKDEFICRSFLSDDEESADQNLAVRGPSIDGSPSKQTILSSWHQDV